ncbi:ZIP family metal transporter [Herbivorax sp. ANBcel31]|uniref:ZIP family metal transporter n=1 Tax=Herbivorax sp. ANBcel31 TaxID=3069754 RepID=UPI0027B10568|nr:ZIP family metal transporter [Herbivorax sp. ANBcel31]MDQ2087672.1 ZIP family metal transporter [Herbivorax sp. ANBcel31]
MDYLLKITLIGLVSGMIGTGIGGLTVFFVSAINRRLLSLLLEFSAGLMTAVVCFKLLPEAIDFAGLVLTLAGVAAGVLSIISVEEVMNKKDGRKAVKKRSGLLRAGILMSIGIALHNFPEGFAIGAGFEASASLGILLTAIIVIHDIPEGVAMAVPMKLGGYSSKKAFMLTLLSGTPMGMGTLLGAVLGRISTGYVGVCLGFAAGAMLYVVYAELIIESKKLYMGRLPSLGNVTGIVCGIIISIASNG